MRIRIIGFVACCFALAACAADAEKEHQESSTQDVSASTPCQPWHFGPLDPNVPICPPDMGDGFQFGPQSDAGAPAVACQPWHFGPMDPNVPVCPPDTGDGFQFGQH